MTRITQQVSEISTVLLWLCCFLALSMPVLAQEAPKEIPDGTEGVFFVMPEKDSITGEEKPLPINEFDTRLTTIKFGMGYIHDFVAYRQSETFLQQMDSLDYDLEATLKVRDFRVLGSGVFKTKRTLSWKFAFMWDGNLDSWLVRESGLTIGVPELGGHFFIGRTKEGYSLVKVMNGHSPWTAERQMAIDLVPILADGIKWYGTLPKSRIFWNLGAFNDVFSEGQGFSTYEWQYVARVGWMPFYKPEEGTLMHLGTSLRYGKPLDNMFQARSRPESNPTPFLIETGEFPADRSSHVGLEAYYSLNRFMVGSEVAMHFFTSSVAPNHQFYGGNLFVSYFFTKTVRPYKTIGSIYGFVPMEKSVFNNGIGALEGVLHFSVFDLNDGNIQGGRIWKLTAQTNWYLSKVIRLELLYSFAELHRFNLGGGVQFFQSRIQFSIL